MPSGLRRFSCSRIDWLLWHVHVHFDCTNSLKLCIPTLGLCIFLEKSGMKWLLWHVHVNFDGALSGRMEILVKSLRGPDARSCTGPVRSCGDPVQILLVKVLALRSWRCSALELPCMEVLLGCSVLVWRSCNILHIEGHSLTLLWNSLWPGMKFWYEVLHKELLVLEALTS